MTDDRFDFRPVDRLASPEGLERAIAGIMAAAAPELARRAESRNPFLTLARWATPALATAALIAAVSLATLWRVQRPQVMPLASVSEVLLPAPAGAWVAEDRPPNNSDLIQAVEGESQ